MGLARGSKGGAIPGIRVKPGEEDSEKELVQREREREMSIYRGDMFKG